MRKRIVWYVLLLIIPLTLALTSCKKPKVYTITLPEELVGGNISSDAFRVEEGGSISLIITSNKGFELEYLKVNDNDVKGDVVDGVYTIKNIKNNITITSSFKTIEYSITYNLDGGTNPNDTKSSYTVNDKVILPQPTKENYVFEGWYNNESLTGNQISSIDKGSTGNKKFYAKWIENFSYTVSGQISMGSYMFNNTNYLLNNLNYEDVVITFAGPMTKIVNAQTTGEYTTELVQGEYTVTFACENFVPYTTTIVVNEGKTVNASVTTPLLGGTVTNGEWAVVSEDNLWINNENKTTITSSKVAQVYFSGQTASKFLMHTKISNLVTTNDKIAGVIVAGYKDSDALVRHEVLFDDRDDLLQTLETNSWTWTDLLTFESDLVNDDKEITVIRDGKLVYLYIDNKFMTKYEINYEEEAAFGFQTIGCGATYSEYFFSYNEELIDAMIKGSVVIEEFENGEITIDKTNPSLGEEILITITPTTNEYKIKSFTINGENKLGILQYNDGIYTGRYVVATNQVQIDTSLEKLPEVKLSGNVQSGHYKFKNTNYDLYSIDHSLVKVIYINKETNIIYETQVNADLTYTINIPEGNYKVTFEYPNFVGTESEVSVNSTGVTEETLLNTNIIISIPKLGGDIVMPNGTLINQDNKWDFTTESNHFISTDYESNAYFTNITGERYVIEAIIKNVHPRIDKEVEDLRAGIIFDALFDNGIKRNAIILDQTEGKIRPWINNAYDNVNAVLGVNLSISSETGHKLTIIRDNSIYHIFLDGEYVKSLNNGHLGESAIGFQTLGSGATYSNYLYSFNDELIDAMLTKTISLPDIDKGTIESSKSNNVKLGDDIIITVTPKEGFVVKSFQAFINGVLANDIILINNQATFKVIGDLTFTVEFEVSKTVKGSIEDTYYNFLGVDYKLYNIDYTLATISFNNGTTSYFATINEDGTYNAKLPKGTYEVVYAHRYFEDVKGNIVIDENGNVIDNENILYSSFTTPKLGGSVKSGTGTVGGGNDEALWTYQDGKATASKVAQVYFSGQTGTRYMVEARVHNLKPTNVSTDRDKKASIIIAGYNNGSLMRHAIFLDEDNNLVRLWNNGSWDSINKVENHDLDLKNEIGNKLTLIRDGMDVYVFLDDVFLTKLAIPYGEETAFGFQTLGCGATYSDYNYSYNNDLIDAMIASINS